MPAVSPFKTFEHLKETLVSYLETAYKIAHPDVSSERRALLQTDGAVSQKPLIETTPGYQHGRWLRQLIADFPQKLDPELETLIGFGTPLAKNKLWLQQDEALAKWCGPKPNLVVATGTASGKTEIFLLPILAAFADQASIGWCQYLQ